MTAQILDLRTVRSTVATRGLGLEHRAWRCPVGVCSCAGSKSSGSNKQCYQVLSCVKQYIWDPLLPFIWTLVISRLLKSVCGKPGLREVMWWRGVWKKGTKRKGSVGKEVGAWSLELLAAFIPAESQMLLRAWRRPAESAEHTLCTQKPLDWNLPSQLSWGQRWSQRESRE